VSWTPSSKGLSVVESAKFALANPDTARKQREADEAREAAAARQASYNPDPTPTPGKLKELRGLYERNSEVKPKAPASMGSSFLSFLGASSTQSPPPSPSRPAAAKSSAIPRPVASTSAGSEVDAAKRLQTPAPTTAGKSKYSDFINSGRQPSSSGYVPPPVPVTSPPAYVMPTKPSYLPRPPTSPAPTGSPRGTVSASPGLQKFRTPARAGADADDKPVSMTTAIVSVFFYALLLLAALRYEDLYKLSTQIAKDGKLDFPSFGALASLFGGRPSVPLTSPYVGHFNASNVVKRRLTLVQQDFEEALTANGWEPLWTSNNVTVEALDVDGSWPIYVRSFAVFDCKPQKLYDLVNWGNYDATQKVVDPFHESSRLLSNPSSHIKIVRKTTKRPFIMPKREFMMALVEKTHRSSFSVKNVKVRSAPMTLPRDIKVERGILVNAVVNVNTADDVTYPGGKRGASAGYIRAYQDMMGYFVPLASGGTMLVSIMRVDLGPDIPRFAFKTTLGATVSWGMSALRKLSNK